MNEPSYTNPMDEDARSGSSLVWLIMGVAAMGCGLLVAAGLFFFREDAQSLFNQYFPSPTATASRTPVPTRTPSPTPTPNRTATQQVLEVTSTAQAIQTTAADALGSWQVVLADTFETNTNQWPTGTREGERLTSVRDVTNGVFVWDITSKDGFFAWITPSFTLVNDFYLTVEIQHISGTSSSDQGLVFREDESNNLYYFGISEDEFHVSLSYNNEWIDIIAWQESSALRPEEKNKLTVIGQGSYFIFLINDQIVGEATDDQIESGTCAIAVQMFDAGLQGTFEFDNYELRIP